MRSKSFLAKKEEVVRKWWIIDASQQVLGRLSSQVATLLRGKHKEIYTPHVDCGDHVVVINAEQVRLTGNKLEQKLDYRHTGYPSGQKVTTYKLLIKENPEKMVTLAIKGMLPKSSLGKRMLTKLRVYRGNKTPHAAQKLEPFILVN